MNGQVYQFGKKRSFGRKVKLDRVRQDTFRLRPEKEPPMEPIQGILPDSREEWRTAKALDRLKLGYVFQYEVEGGRRVRGGQVVDFLVLTPYLPTPVYVQGSYWHKGSRASESAFKVQEIQRLLHGQANPPVELWDHELTSINAAYHILREKLRV